MSDAIESVDETTATGQVAELFADIRATLGVPAVALIWRHLATLPTRPNSLAWAWTVAKPLYSSGIVMSAARSLREGLDLPALPKLTRSEYQKIGVADSEKVQIDFVLSNYDRGNALNIVALKTVLLHLKGMPIEGVPASAPAHDKDVPLQGSMPKLLTLEEMAPETAELVLNLNRLGARDSDVVMASAFRQLAHWPSLLPLFYDRLSALQNNGVLLQLVDDVARLSDRRASDLVANLGHASPLPDPAREQMGRAIEAFVTGAIERMIVIVPLLRRLL